MAMKVIGALALIVGLVPGRGWAEAPARFAYQGRLLKADLSGPATGPVKLTFAVYDQSESGSALWTESQANVALTDGYYATSLGDQVALNAALFASGDRFLELAVNDEPMRPRERLASVPSALVCTSASGGPVAATSLSAQGGLATALTGVVAASAGSTTVVGSGTHFKSELQAGDAVRVGTAVYRVKSIASDTSLELDPAPAAGFPAGTTLFRDGVLFRVANGAKTSQLTVNQSGDLGVRTDAPLSSLSFGRSCSTASGCLDKPHGYAWNGTCRNDVLSVWEDGENNYGFGIHPGALEIFSPQGLKSQIGIRNTGGGDAKLTGQFTSMLEVGDGYVRIGNVSAPSSNTSPGAGTALYFSGGPSLAGGFDSDNSDPLAIYRYNVASDVTEMRVQIGDNINPSDSFAVGVTDYNNNSAWTPAFKVSTKGDYQFAGSAVSTRESKRDIRPFDERALDVLRPVQVVNFHYKEDASNRALRVGIIANDPAHTYDARLTNNGTGFDPQTAAALLIKAVQEQQALIEEQRTEIARLHTIVCQDRPGERLCRR